MAARFLDSSDMPASVTIPRPIGHDGVTYAGTHAGFLGPRFDPMEFRESPIANAQAIHPVGLADDMSATRLVARQADRRSGDYSKFLTPAQFAATFAPSQEEYDGLAAELVRLGLSITRKVDGRTTLSVKGPAAVVEKVFGTELLEYLTAGRSK